MLRETKGLLIGESARTPVLHDIEQLLAADSDVADVRRVLTMQLGPGAVLVAADLRFAPRLSADAVAAAVRRLEAQLRRVRPEIRQVFVEATALDRGEVSERG